MEVLELARLQFGISTVCHLLLVPVSIGFSTLVAMLQTLWHTTGRTAYRRATEFWGRLLLISFGTGLVTCFVHELQFALNWSAYSRFVGDVFGAPFALEVLLAFFAGATFIGVWVFGRDRLNPALHLACVWIIAIGTVAGAYFIHAVNSFTQNPVGYRIDATAGRAELADLGAVLTNPVALAAFPHTVFTAWMMAGVVVIAVSGHHFKRRRDLDVHRPPLRLGILATLVGGFGLLVSGAALGKVTIGDQPMKTAAAEMVMFNAPFSALTIGSGGRVLHIPLTYWSFRLMIGFAVFAIVMAVVVWWGTRHGRVPAHRLFWPTAMWTVLTPFLANTTGWILTETGRQPWVGGYSSAASMIDSTLAYAILLGIALKLFLCLAKAGPTTEETKVSVRLGRTGESRRALSGPRPTGLRIASAVRYLSERSES